MAPLITAAASLFPRGISLASVGYGCTSATSVIGADKISKLLSDGCEARNTTNPLTAAVAACTHIGVRKCGLVTPYLLEVNKTMIEQLEVLGSITTECVTTFMESTDYNVARIDPESIYEAAVKLANDNVGKIDFLFLSCTNLRTLSIISRIENETAIPCLSSNLCWAWHMAQQSGAKLSQIQSKLIQSGSATAGD
jgi:maleate isomerase